MFVNFAVRCICIVALVPLVKSWHDVRLIVLLFKLWHDVCVMVQQTALALHCATLSFARGAHMKSVHHLSRNAENHCLLFINSSRTATVIKPGGVLGTFVTATQGRELREGPFPPRPAASALHVIMSQTALSCVSAPKYTWRLLCSSSFFAFLWARITHTA